MDYSRELCLSLAYTDPAPLPFRPALSVVDRRSGLQTLDAVNSEFVGEIHVALRGTNCQAFPSDLRVRVLPKRMYIYPDVTMVCGKPLLADEHQDILLNPVVIFEVLSPSTEHYDRGVKFQHYRKIESLEDYILVDQNKMRIEQFTRGEANTWTLRDYQRAEEKLRIDSIRASVPLARIYDRVELLAG